MKRLYLALILLVLATWPAHAQSPVTVIGPITANDCVKFNSTTIITDAGFICTGQGILPNATVAGTVLYFNGTTWVIFAGNTSGTNCLGENAVGAPQWTTCAGGSGANPGGTSGQIQYNAAGTFGGVTLSSQFTTLSNTVISLAGYAPAYGLSTGGSASANATALAAACTASPTVYIPTGTYNIQTASLAGCAKVYGDGIGQTKLVAAGSPSVAILYFNGNANVLVEDLEVDNTSSLATINGIECLSSAHCVIRNVLAEGNIGIYCSIVADCLIENSTVDSYGTYGIDTSQGTAAKVQFNTISGPAVGSNHGIVCQLQTSCAMSYNKSTGALIFNYEVTDASDVFVHGNYSLNSIHEGINVTYNSGPAPTRIVISDNVALFNGSSLDYCISVNAAGTSAVKGSIVGNICDTPGSNGIVLVQGVQYWQVSDNTIISPNALNIAATGAAIQFQGGSTTNNVASNNSITDLAGHMAVVGLELTDGTGSPNANTFGPNFGSRGSAGPHTRWLEQRHNGWILRMPGFPLRQFQQLSAVVARSAPIAHNSFATSG